MEPVQWAHHLVVHAGSGVGRPNQLPSKPNTETSVSVKVQEPRLTLGVQNMANLYSYGCP